MSPPCSILLDAAGKAFFTVDQVGTISSCSEGVSHVFGWPPGEINGANVSRLGLSDLLQPQAGDRQNGELTATNRLGESVEIAFWAQRLSDPKAGYAVLVEDISEKKFLEHALLEATEREQRRIGQELHDHLCQHLLGAAFAAKALAGSLDRDGSSHAGDLHDLARLINDSVSQARDISRGLHPVELDSAGLMSALQELANRVNQTIPCVFTCKKSVLIEKNNPAQNAYRIAQEAVSQSLQTGATSIRISLAPIGDSICLEISDNSAKQGELSAHPQGTAARTLHYRAQAMNGSLLVSHEPGKGNRTTCTFPQHS